METAVHCLKIAKLTAVVAVTKPNIGTLASASARLAPIIAAPNADPPLSKTVA